jgi:uncharacterized phage protein (TIGR02218 family)
MQAHLNSGATTLCWCWALARRDGVVQGFTDHDAPIVFGGVTYDAASGFTASEVQSSLGLAIDNLTLAGALSSVTLNEDDLAAGLYDNADVTIWRVNWAAPEQRVLMRKGNLGQVARNGNAFQAEVRGLAHVLNQPVGRAYGHLCDADLGDGRCGVALAGFTVTGTVANVSDARRFSVTGLDSYTSDFFSGGKLTFTTGTNAARAMEVKRHALSGGIVSLELWQAMSRAVAPGDVFSISAGCDKQFATCRGKFSNAANFRGFPYMPGNDAAFATPANGQILDGASRNGNTHSRVRARLDRHALSSSGQREGRGLRLSGPVARGMARMHRRRAGKNAALCARLGRTRQRRDHARRLCALSGGSCPGGCRTGRFCSVSHAAPFGRQTLRHRRAPRWSAEPCSRAPEQVRQRRSFLAFLAHAARLYFPGLKNGISSSGRRR